MSLEENLQNEATGSRINAIDAAYRGNPYKGSNFVGKWNGYNADGFAIVKYQDREYTASNIAGRSARLNQRVILRVAKGKRQVNY